MIIPLSLNLNKSGKIFSSGKFYFIEKSASWQYNSAKKCRGIPLTAGRFHFIMGFLGD